MKRNRFERNKLAPSDELTGIINNDVENGLDRCKFEKSTVEEMGIIYDDIYQKARDAYREYKACQEEYRALKAKKETLKIDKIKKSFRLKELKAKMKALRKISDLHSEALIQFNDVEEYVSKFNKIKNYDYDPKIYKQLNSICNKSITKTETFFMFFIIGLMALMFFMLARL